MKKNLLVLIPIVICLIGCDNQHLDKSGEVIYGNFITMDEANPTAEAVYIKNGKIEALGSKDDISKYITNGVSEVTYSNDNYIYPGFIDPHTHYAVMTTFLTDSAVLEREKPGEYEMGDLQAYAKEIKKFVDANPNKDIYQGYGMWVLDEIPTAKVLDDLVPTDKPIVVVGAGGHDCWLNTPAIKQYIGNYEGTDEEKIEVDKWINQVGQDCVITKDEEGHKIPTGYFCETARFRITDKIAHNVEDIKETIRGIQELTLHKGYVTVGDCSIVENENNKQVTAFKELCDAGELKMKFRSYYEIREYDCKETRKSELQKAIKLANETKDNDYFQIIGIKVFLDGVYEALSAYTLDEYTPEANKRNGYKGIQRWYEGDIEGEDLSQELKELVYEANKAGLAMEFHAMGDGAIRQALDACEYSNEKLVSEGKIKFDKNAISHLGYIHPDDMNRFAKLGVTAVVAPEWAGAVSSIYPNEVKALGEAKAEKMFSIQNLINTGANVAFHTDGAVLGGVPEMIYDAVTRRDATHEKDILHVRGEDEKVTGKQSLKCLTVNAAHPLNSATINGVIKIGGAADFTIYNKDYRDNAVASSLKTFEEAKLIALYVSGVNQLITNFED